MPDMRIVEQPLTEASLRDYAQISIAFSVESYLRVDLINQGLTGLRFVEVPMTAAYTKDYDFDPAKGEGPARWLRWASDDSVILVAFEGEQRIGSVVLLTHVEGMEFLRGCSDTVALWDIRVAQESRRHGIGRALFAAAVAWAKARGYRRLKIETQNINVAACYFYVAQGCYLGGIETHAYADFPDETQLIWYYDLT